MSINEVLNIIFLCFYISLKAELDKIKKEKDAVVKEKEEFRINLTKLTKNSENEITELKKQLNEANQKVHVSQSKIDGELKSCYIFFEEKI